MTVYVELGEFTIDETARAKLLGGVVDGQRYRLVVRDYSGVERVGIVRASVDPVKIQIITGHITFALEGNPMNSNGLYAGPINEIVSIEAIDE